MFRRALLLALVVCSAGVLSAAVHPAAAGDFGGGMDDDWGSDDGETPEDAADDEHDDGDADEGSGAEDEAEDDDEHWYDDWGSDDDRSEYGSDRNDTEDDRAGEDPAANESDGSNADGDAERNETGDRAGPDEEYDGSHRENETDRTNESDATDGDAGERDDEDGADGLVGRLLGLTNESVQSVTDGVAADVDGDGDPDVELVETDDGSVRVGTYSAGSDDDAGDGGGVEVVEVELTDDLLLDDRGRLRAGNLTIGGVLEVPIGPPDLIAQENDDDSADRPGLDAPSVDEPRTTPTATNAASSGDSARGAGEDGRDDTDGQAEAAGGGDAGDGGAGGTPESGAGTGAALVVTVGLLGGSRTALQGTTALASQGTGSALTSLRHAAAGVLDRVLRVLPAVVGYSRHDDSDPLENDTRSRIYDLVRESPGTYHAQLAEETGVAVETVRYHSRILEEEGLVEVRKLRGRRRLFPVSTDDDDPELAAAIADSAAADVLTAIERREPATLSAIAEAVDCAPSTVSYHLDRLEDDGLVTRERDGGAVSVRLRRTTRSALSGRVADD